MNAADTSDPGRLGSWLPSYLALALIWGSGFLLIKVGLRDLHPMYVSLGRVGFGALTVLGILALMRGRLLRGLRVWGHLTFIGTIGTALPFTLIGYAEQRISSVLAGIWNCVTPLLVLPIAVLVFRTERMTLPRLLGLSLGFLGVLTVLGAWEGVGGAEFTGQLMCLGAALCYAVAIPYQRRFLSALPGSGVAAPAGQLLTASAALLVIAPLVAGAPPHPATLSAEVVGSVAALGALGAGVAFVLGFRVIQHAGASTAASVSYLLPVVATVIGITALGERVTWHQPTGAVLVLVGVAVSQSALGARTRRGRARTIPQDAPLPTTPRDGRPGRPECGLAVMDSTTADGR